MKSREKKVNEYIDKLNEAASSKDIIAGIHNYCDRWCERCTKTKHCTVYKTEKLRGLDVDDATNEEFWEYLSITFEATAKMLKQGLEKWGIDINDIDLDQVELKHHKETNVEKIAKEYSVSVMKWLESNEENIKQLIEQDVVANGDSILAINDAYEVINWYSMFISVKTHRAMNVLFNDGEFYDNLGSAKIAIIAINRSTEAFGYLYNKMPEKEDEILNFLVTLSKIKKLLLNRWPKAMEFVRVGFDD